MQLAEYYYLNRNQIVPAAENEDAIPFHCMLVLSLHLLKEASVLEWSYLKFQYS